MACGTITVTLDCTTNHCASGCPDANTCSCQPCLAGCPDATACGKCGNSACCTGQYQCDAGCPDANTCTCNPTLCPCVGDSHCDSGCPDANDPILCPPECAGTAHCNVGCPDATSCGMCGNDPCATPFPWIAVLGIALIGGFVVMSGGGTPTP
jgi:hypothetical protein